MHKMKLLACLLALLNASCASIGNGKTAVELSTVDTACEWVKPIRIAASDKLSDGTARQILALNKAQLAACPTGHATGTLTDVPGSLHVK